MTEGNSATLSSNEMLRYTRHLLLPEVGIKGQQKLKSARVLCAGVGGLGSPLAFYLAAAGVGTIGLIDEDVVHVSNLQRQILHADRDCGRSKVDSAAEKLEALNSTVRIVRHPVRLTALNAFEILRQYDLVADGTDNVAARYLINDACVMLGKPNVHGAIDRFTGMMSIFGAPDGPCYRCLFPVPPRPGQIASCAQIGVLGVVPGLIGLMQATEIIKWIVGIGEPLVGVLLRMDALAESYRKIVLPKDPDCPLCGQHPSIRHLQEEGEVGCALSPGAHASDSERDEQISPRELRQRLARNEDLFLLDVRAPEAFAQFNLGGHVIPVEQVVSRLDEIDKNSEVVVICAVGVHSQSIAELLRERGFPRVRNLRGGLQAWLQESAQQETTKEDAMI
jgi:adenylyltransferase/sulfurtransferase